MKKATSHIEDIILSGKSILLFDGVCNMCNDFVQFVLKRDKKGQFVFASLQSAAGQKILDQYQLSKDLKTVVLVDKEKAYTKSDVALIIGQRLGGWLRIAYLGWFIPRFIRDGIYKTIAANRYRIFGKKEECMLPKPEWRNRFL